jgi:hypothetical protein
MNIEFVHGYTGFITKILPSSGKAVSKLPIDCQAKAQGSWDHALVMCSFPILRPPKWLKANKPQIE